MDKEIMRGRLNEVFKGEIEDKTAAKLNMSQSGVSKIKNGNQSITIDTAYIISKVYNVSVDWLLGLTDVKEVTKTSNDITYYQAVDALLQMKSHGSFKYEKGKITIEDPMLRFLLDEADGFQKNSTKYIDYWKREELIKLKDKRLLYSAAFLDEEFKYLAYGLRNVDDALKLHNEGVEAEKRTVKAFEEENPFDKASEENI